MAKFLAALLALKPLVCAGSRLAAVPGSRCAAAGCTEGWRLLMGWIIVFTASLGQYADRVGD